MSTFIFLDFEFTTYEKQEAPPGFFHEVIEVGMITLKAGEWVDEFSSFVKPESFPQLSPKIRELTGIQQHQVDEGITFHRMIDRLQQHYVPNETTFVTWGNMDITALRRNCRERKVPFPLSVKLEDWLDLSQAYRHFYGYEQTPSLWKALEACGLKEEKQSHRALDDSLATLYVYEKMKQDQWKYIHPGDMPMFSSSIADLLGDQLAEKLKKFITPAS